MQPPTLFPCDDHFRFFVPAESKALRVRSWQLWRAFACIALIVSALLLTPASYAFGDDSGVVAVYSAVSPAYTRTVLPGGSFKPETFAFGEGGNQGGALNDATIDKLHFIDVARRIAPALAGKNYLPTKDPQQTDLLIMVYWGTTSGTDRQSSSPEFQIAQSLMPLQALPPALPMPAGPSGPAMQNAKVAAQDRSAMEIARNSMEDQALTMIHLANRQRDQQDIENAKVLGYLPEMIRLNDYKETYFNRLFRQDVIDDVEEGRYYVVLLAYDFQTLWKTKQRKLLWETRFSIRERRNDFGESLVAMAQNAARYFGQDSHGLIRERLHETNITLGEPKVLEYEPEKKK
jgi:hypothetical protein